MIGKKLAGRYELTGEVGRGGMGVVYRARDPRLNREVAVKLIPPTLLSADAEQRFEREAQIVAQMDHPAIVSIFDFGRHEGSLFFVMPLVQGTNLHAFRRQRSALGDIVDIGNPGGGGARVQPRARRGPPGHQAREHHGGRRRRERCGCG